MSDVLPVKQVRYVFDAESFMVSCRIAVGRRNHMKRTKRIALADVAAETGISRGFLHLMSKGENFSMQTYLDICNELDLNPAGHFKAIVDETES